MRVLVLLGLLSVALAMKVSFKKETLSNGELLPTKSDGTRFESQCVGASGTRTFAVQSIKGELKMTVWGRDSDSFSAKFNEKKGKLAVKFQPTESGPKQASITLEDSKGSFVFGVAGNSIGSVLQLHPAGETFDYGNALDDVIDFGKVYNKKQGKKTIHVVDIEKCKSVGKITTVGNSFKVKSKTIADGTTEVKIQLKKAKAGKTYRADLREAGNTYRAGKLYSAEFFEMKAEGVNKPTNQPTAAPVPAPVYPKKCKNGEDGLNSDGSDVTDTNGRTCEDYGSAAECLLFGLDAVMSNGKIAAEVCCECVGVEEPVAPTPAAAAPTPAGPVAVDDPDWTAVGAYTCESYFEMANLPYCAFDSDGATNGCEACPVSCASSVSCTCPLISATITVNTELCGTGDFCTTCSECATTAACGGTPAPEWFAIVQGSRTTCAYYASYPSWCTQDTDDGVEDALTGRSPCEACDSCSSQCGGAVAPVAPTAEFVGPQGDNCAWYGQFTDYCYEEANGQRACEECSGCANAPVCQDGKTDTTFFASADFGYITCDQISAPVDECAAITNFQGTTACEACTVCADTGC